ncbi:MAG: PEP-utilizing enzyme [Patescibacteria group bacterium]
MKVEEIISKYKIDQSTWTYKGFHGVLHTFFPVGQTGFPMKKIYGDSSTITLFFVTNDYVHWYWNDNDLDRVRNLFLDNLKKDKNYLKKIQNDWYKKINDFESVIDKVDKINLEKLNDEELALLYDSFYEAYLEQFTYFMTLGDAVSMHADRYIIPEFEKILGNRFNEIFPKLITTKHISFIEEEQVDREKLLQYLKDGKKIPLDKLEQHSAKYFYIQNNYAKGNYLTVDDFSKIIYQDFKKLIDHTPSKTRESILKEREGLIKELKLSKWNLSLIDMMDEFFGIQDTRKKYVLMANYYQFKFLREVEKRTKVPFDLLTYSVYSEFRKVLAKKIDKEELEGRKEMCVCIQTPNSYEIISGKTVKELLDLYQNKKGVTEELKGVVASKGKAQGVVKIILKIHDMINMDEGDILVSSMTRPEMAPAMKKAAAIITDEGGITCHAAIVSRELGIPCIIGTKIATQVLKDGDKVEVDADNGVVKKLN